jgi:hypothetical protein
MNEKYLAFGPYRSGLGNVIMSYECALAIAHITNRKLILPPTLHLTHIKAHSKEINHSLWDLFDEAATRQEFDIEDYHSHPNFQGKFEQMQTSYSWFENLPNVVSDCYNWKVDPGESVYWMTGSSICFVSELWRHKDSEDFKLFAGNRRIIDANWDYKYLLFENNLFQNYWYIVYPGGPAERNKLKNKVNKAIRYKQSFYDTFENSLMNRIGPYNAVHVRRNDFFIQFSYSLRTVDEGRKLLSQLLRVFDPNKPLYIATDESNSSFFDPVRQVFKSLYFISDIQGDYTNLDKAILDQIICSRADEFYGIKNSTFTRRINVMRGLEGRTARDNTGINALDEVEPEQGFFPWNHRPDKQWSWNMSSYLQWTQEHVS